MWRAPKQWRACNWLWVSQSRRRFAASCAECKTTHATRRPRAALHSLAAHSLRTATPPAKSHKWLNALARSEFQIRITPATSSPGAPNPSNENQHCKLISNPADRAGDCAATHDVVTVRAAHAHSPARPHPSCPVQTRRTNAPSARNAKQPTQSGVPPPNPAPAEPQKATSRRWAPAPGFAGSLGAPGARSEASTPGRPTPPPDEGHPQSQSQSQRLNSSLDFHQI